MALARVGEGDGVADLLASALGIGYAAADDNQIDRLLAIVRDGITR